MKTSPLSSAGAAVRLDWASVSAVLKSQLVVTWPMMAAISSRVSSALSCRATASLELTMRNVPSAIFGCNTPQAPSKKMKALLSLAAPA